MPSFLSSNNSFSKVDLQNANVEQVSDQLEELIGYRPSHKVCVYVFVCVRAHACACICSPVHPVVLMGSQTVNISLNG